MKYYRVYYPCSALKLIEQCLKNRLWLQSATVSDSFGGFLFTVGRIGDAGRCL